MNFISMVGAFLITFAFISYGIGSISMQRFSQISKEVLWFFSMGVVLNISAIICMISGAQMASFTLHIFLGYSALFVMFIELLLLFYTYGKRGLNTFIDKWLRLYARLAYGWWIIAYIVGIILVINK